MSQPQLSKKIAVVTGASRGIGAAVSLALAKEGAHVVLVARTMGALESVDDAIKDAGGQSSILPVDFKHGEDIDKIGPTLYERFGTLDILIGNAGLLGPLSPVGHVSPKDWAKVMDINFTANVRLLRTCESLIRQSEAGRVVFTTSGAAEKCGAYWSPYASSKAALNTFMKCYAAETEKTNIRVNAVSPGAVQTNMLDDAYPGGFQDGPVKSPEDVTAKYLELCAPTCSSHGQIHSL